MSEADVMRDLQKRASQMGARLFRQNTGMAWVGDVRRVSRPEMVRMQPGDVLLRKARPFHSGVVGMSDLGGWVPVQVTASMVGQTVAVYAQVEVKAGTKATPEQMAWINAVNGAGGRAGVARDADELAVIISGNRYNAVDK